MAGLSPAMMSLLNMAGWWFLPDQITTQGVAFFHYFLRSRGMPAPKRGSQQYITHLKWMYSIVIIGYLIYSLVDSLGRTPPNFYEILAVRQNATDQDLKLAFRSFARRYHPDRIGPRGEALFIAVRDAYEALRDPLKRYGYDRFGIEALTWKEPTQVEILYKGSWKQSGFYIISLAMLLFGSYVQQSSSVIFWRYFLLVALFTIEIQLVLLPDTPSLVLRILSFIFPQRVAYQHILFMHQIYVSSAIALTRVFPVVFAGDARASKDPNALRGVANRIAELVRNAHAQASVMLRREAQYLMSPSDDHPLQRPGLHPVSLDEETLTQVADEWECIIVEQTLASHPGMRPTWEAALERVRARRQQAARAATPEMMHTNGNAHPNAYETPLKEGTAVAGVGSSPSPFTGRLLSPESDDGREYVPQLQRRSSAFRVKREKSRSPSP